MIDTEITVPGTSSGELDGGGRIQHADKILAAVTKEVAGGS